MKGEIKDTIPTLMRKADINQINNITTVLMCFEEDTCGAIKENNKEN